MHATTELFRFFAQINSNAHSLFHIAKHPITLAMSLVTVQAVILFIARLRLRNCDWKNPRVIVSHIALSVRQIIKSDRQERT